MIQTWQQCKELTLQRTLLLQLVVPSPSLKPWRVSLACTTTLKTWIEHDNRNVEVARVALS